MGVTTLIDILGRDNNSRWSRVFHFYSRQKVTVQGDKMKLGGIYLQSILQIVR